MKSQHGTSAGVRERIVDNATLTAREKTEATEDPEPAMEQPAPARDDPYAVLRIPAYRLYLAGHIANILGGQIQAVAVGWEVYQRTNSALALGTVSLVQFLPIVLLTLPAGQTADRFDRKRQALAALGLFTVNSLALALISAGYGPLSLMYVCLLLFGVGRAFLGPARTALLPQIVPREIFSRAVTWNINGFMIASMAGPALGGALIAWTGSATANYICASLGALIFFILMLGIKGTERAEAPAALSRAGFVAGIRYVWETKVILGAMTLDLFAVLLGGATALMPIYARDILHVGPRGLGWLLAAPSIGAVLTGFLLAHRPPAEKAGRTLLIAVTGFGMATIVFGFSRSFWFSLLLLFLMGVFDTFSVVIRHTLVQTLTPDHMRGRVSSVFGLFVGTSNELGGAESNYLAAFAGPVFSVVAGGIGTILVVISVACAWPQLRDYHGEVDGRR
ncbi:MAG: MFS transporter [Blastocatellia bacterium]